MTKEKEHEKIEEKIKEIEKRMEELDRVQKLLQEYIYKIYEDQRRRER